jgi:WD40 repeat protein
VRLFDLTQQKESSSLPLPTEASTLAYSPDGRWLLVGDKLGSVQVIDAATRECQRVLGGHRSEVLALGFLPDGRATTVDDSGLLKVWELNRSATLPGAAPLVLSADSRRLAAATADRRGIRVWELPGRAELAELPLPPAENVTPAVPIALAFAAKDRELWCVTDDRTVRRWNLAERKVVESISLGAAPDVNLGPAEVPGPAASDAKPVSADQPPFLGDVPFIAYSAAFSPDRRYLLLSAGWSKHLATRLSFQSTGWQDVQTVELWDLRQGQRLVNWGGAGRAEAMRVAFDAQGERAYAAALDVLRRPTIRGWDMLGRPLNGELRFPTPLQSVVSPDGTRELKNHLGAMKLYNKSSGRELVTLWPQVLETMQFAASGDFVVGVGAGANRESGIQIIDATPQVDFPPPPPRRKTAGPAEE